MKKRSALSTTLPKLGVAIAAAALLVGCETTAPKSYRTHPEFRALYPAAARQLAAEADIQVKQVATGGVPEEMDGYSEEVARLFSARLGQTSSDSAARVWRPLAVEDETLDVEYKEALALAQVVYHDMLLYAYHEMYPGFEHKRVRFDYSIGDVSSLLDPSEGDALLIIFGEDHYSTGGRKMVNGMLTILSAAAAGASGSGSVFVGQDGFGYINAMLVNRDGKVLWMAHYPDPALDLRQDSEVDRVISLIRKDLAEAESLAGLAAK